MIRELGGQGRCPGEKRCASRGSRAAETRVRRATVVDGANPLHPLLPRQGVARPRSASTGAGGQALAECRVAPRDVRRVEHPIAVRATPEPLNACGYAIKDAAFDGNNASLDGALDDRRHAEVGPRTHPGTPLDACLHRLATRLANRADVGPQASAAAQEGTGPSAAAYTPDSPTNQRHIALDTDVASEPHACLDPQGSCPPHAVTLFLDPSCLGLHMAEVPRWLHQLFLNGLPLDASARQPTCHCPLVIAKGDDERWPWTPVGHQRHHETDRLRRGPQAIQRRACRSSARLPALRAEEALVRARMEADISLACLSSGGARQRGAERACGVHEDSPLLALLGSVPRRSMSGPPCSWQANLTTV
jgi:hypothetical protein